MWQYNYSDEIYHYGVKGMKWGVRRFQNKNGSLTNAGRKRYDDDNGNGNGNGKSAAPSSKKTISKSTNISLNTSVKKSNHRLKLEEKYKQQGMTKEQAEIAAEKRIRTEKIVAVVGAMTVAAATAYVVNKNIKYRADSIIKSGTTMQRITLNKNETLDNAFYSSYKNSDKLKYKGKFGKELTDPRGVKSVYNMSINTNQDVKIASRKKAVDTFKDLWENDAEFRKNYNKLVDTNVKGNQFLQDNVYNKMARKIDKASSYDKVKEKAYDLFNANLANHTPENDSMAKQFYNKLKEQGYDAIIDVNDNKYSGYRTKKPVIIFNGNNKISISDVKKMSNEEIEKTYLKNIGTSVVKAIAGTSGVAAGSAYVKNILSPTNMNKEIANYKKEHPNTRLTDEEIKKLLTRR